MLLLTEKIGEEEEATSQASRPIPGSTWLNQFYPISGEGIERSRLTVDEAFIYLNPRD